MAADTIKDVPPRLLEGTWWKDEPIGAIAYAEVKRQEKDKLYLVERYERREENELKEINQFLVEIHKKFSIPMACLVFVFIGVPLGIMARRGGIGTGVIYSVAFYLLYWVCMIRGEVLADKLIISPWMAMWAPNIIVGLGGLFLVVRMARENYLNNISLPQKIWGLVRRKRPNGSRP
jgi:lipopolysaccharide export system permease protein